jgi:hypothetical protein
MWLRTGQRAAASLASTQPTISRNSRKCLETFDLELKRSRGEWRLVGDTQLINLERKVHQQLRWLKSAGLRLEAQHWCAASVSALELPQWKLGNLNYLEYERPIELLRDGVIDAWLCSAPDAPLEEGLSGWQLNSMPMHLLVKPDHPLALTDKGLEWHDLLPYPVLPLPSGAFPVFERVMDRCGLLPCPEREEALKKSAWFGQRPLEDLLIRYGSPLTEHLFDETLVRLPLTLPVRVGDVLITRSEFSEHASLRSLTAQLLDRMAPLAAQRPDVELHRQPLIYAGPSPAIEHAC